MLSRYFNCHAFTEFHLDGIFKYGDDNTLPLEVFSFLQSFSYCISILSSSTITVYFVLLLNLVVSSVIPEMPVPTTLVK